MLRSLFEAHLPVSNLDRSVAFYSKLGLEFAFRDGDSAFFWVEKGKSWVGLWESEVVNTKYHPALRHIAFGVEFDDVKSVIAWLNERGIQPRKDADFEPDVPTEPTVQPDASIASVYFWDPDGNSLEIMCVLPGDTPRTLPRMYFSEWEKLRNSQLSGIDSVE